MPAADSRTASTPPRALGSRRASWPSVRLLGAVFLAGLLIPPLASALLPALLPAHDRATIGPAWGGRCFAQSLDILVDASLGSGVTAGSGDGQTSLRRTPLFMELEINAVIDGDFELEYGLGSMVQLENEPALALRPQVRLVRPLPWFSFFADLGVPLFTTPFTRLGVELGGGVIYALHDRFSLIGSAHVGVYFAGNDLPQDTTISVFDVGLGGRVHF